MVRSGFVQPSGLAAVEQVIDAGSERVEISLTIADAPRGA